MVSSKASEPEKIAYKKGLLSSQRSMANRRNAALGQINAVADTSNSILNHLKMASPRRSPRKNPYCVDPTVISKGGIVPPGIVRRSPRHAQGVNSVVKPMTSGSRSAPKAKRTPKTVASSGSVAGDLLKLGM